MKNALILFAILLIGLSSCSIFTKEKSNEQRVLIETEFGDITIKLYNETPLHRDNFIKLAKEGTLNETLFHRVIKDFMIQGGDPDSKNAKKGVMLGNGGPGYKIPAEFNDKLFHKKGALAAAREGDNVNPKKESSGSQFYIVYGKKYSPAELTNFEKQVNYGKLQNFTKTYLDKNPDIKNRLDSLKLVGNPTRLRDYATKIQEKINLEFANGSEFKYSPEQTEAYTTIGGTPHLDGGYTVFGEIESGMEVVEKIISVETDRNNRPLNDIKMTVKILK